MFRLGTGQREPLKPDIGEFNAVCFASGWACGSPASKTSAGSMPCASPENGSVGSPKARYRRVQCRVFRLGTGQREPQTQDMGECNAVCFVWVLASVGSSKSKISASSMLCASLGAWPAGAPKARYSRVQCCVLRLKAGQQEPKKQDIAEFHAVCFAWDRASGSL